MKTKPQEPEKNFGEDLKTFEQLPAKTKETELLKDQAEKSTGQERVALDKMIRDKSNREVRACLVADNLNQSQFLL